MGYCIPAQILSLHPLCQRTMENIGHMVSRKIENILYVDNTLTRF